MEHKSNLCKDTFVIQQCRYCSGNLTSSTSRCLPLPARTLGYLFIDVSTHESQFTVQRIFHEFKSWCQGGLDGLDRLGGYKKGR